MPGRPFDLPPVPGRAMLAWAGALLAIEAALGLLVSRPRWALALCLAAGLLSWLVAAACYLAEVAADRRYWREVTWVAYPADPGDEQKQATAGPGGRL